MIVCLKRFGKITLDFSLVPVPISSLFLVCIEWYKTWWMHQLGLYRTSLYSKGKDATIKDFKLEILICLIKPSPNTEPRYTKQHILSPLLYRIEGYKCSLNFRSGGIMCQDSTSIEFASVCSLAYLPWL
jgi:hypothetical protein